MEDFKQTIASQYANSPTLVQMIDSMNQYFDPRADLQNFYDYVWNVDTAQGFGLDTWGKIVNVSRDLTILDPNSKVLGFDEADGEPFNQGVFYNGKLSTVTYTLDDDGYRQLILVKALSNISICSAPSINQQLRNLFPGRGKCYVNDNLDMSMRLTFEFALKPYELAIILQANAITRPAAVEVLITSFPTDNFGFVEGNGEPFNQGTFYNP